MLYINTILSRSSISVLSRVVFVDLSDGDDDEDDVFESYVIEAIRDNGDVRAAFNSSMRDNIK